MPDLRVAKLTDVDLIMRARAEASRILDADPELARSEHAALRERVAAMWDQINSDVS